MTELYKLVERFNGLYYKKFSVFPFSGKVTGLQKGLIKNGKMEGVWVRYHPNGQLRYKGNWKNNRQHGECAMYYENGQLRSKGNYKNGQEEGKWVFYSKDGSFEKRFSGIYKVLSHGYGVKISD